MYMDLTDMISGGTEEQQIPEQKLTKEEYAAKKQQEREEVWAEVDSQAQGVFQDGEKLKGFLDFMAECNTQRTPNLLLIYGQHPDFKVVRSYERWREEHRSVKAGEHGITYMISTEYEKDGEMRRGYTIGKGFDISQMSGKPLEERPQRSLTELVGVVLKDQSVRVQIEDNLPDKVQAQYNPRYRTIYIRNGMSEVTTFHQSNQCRYPGHQEENRSPVRLDCRSKSRACQAAGTRPCFSAERLLHPAQSRGVFAERQGQQSKGDERDFQLSPGKRHLLP